MFRYINNTHIVLLALIFLLTTSCNYQSEKKINEQNNTKMSTERSAKVIGIGGIFYKCENPQSTRDWYKSKLGFVTNEYGSLMETLSFENETCYLQWSPMSDRTTYFEPSENDYMINYRVSNLDELFTILVSNGVTILDTIERYEYGNFLHILDNEGNKLELWEPIDSEFTKSYSGNTTISTTVNRIIFKSKSPEKLCNWYGSNLGFDIKSNTGTFKYRNSAHPEKAINLIWQPLLGSSEIFQTNQQLIVGYNVDNIDSLKQYLSNNNFNFLVSEKLQLAENEVRFLDLDNHQIILSESEHE